jgi:hypothetical protein
MLKDAKTPPITRANTRGNKTVNEKIGVLVDQNRVERWKVNDETKVLSVQKIDQSKKVLKHILHIPTITFGIWQLV